MIWIEAYGMTGVTLFVLAMLLDHVHGYDEPTLADMWRQWNLFSFVLLLWPFALGWVVVNMYRKEGEL